jgi:hypothetical protein
MVPIVSNARYILKMGNAQPPGAGHIEDLFVQYLSSNISVESILGIIRPTSTTLVHGFVSKLHGQERR